MPREYNCPKCGAEIDYSPGGITKCRIQNVKECWLGKNTVRQSGGSNLYYRVQIDSPTSPDLPAYTAECNDIIEALNLNFAEGNILKALWRIAAYRQKRQEKTDPYYDAEKIVFFGKRVLKQQDSYRGGSGGKGK